MRKKWGGVGTAASALRVSFNTGHRRYRRRLEAIQVPSESITGEYLSFFWSKSPKNDDKGSRRGLLRQIFVQFPGEGLQED